MLPKPAKRPKQVTNHFKCCLFYSQPDFTAWKLDCQLVPGQPENRTKFLKRPKFCSGNSIFTLRKRLRKRFNRTKFLKHLLKPENWLQKVLYHLLARIASCRKHPVRVQDNDRNLFEQVVSVGMFLVCFLTLHRPCSFDKILGVTLPLGAVLTSARQ